MAENNNQTWRSGGLITGTTMEGSNYQEIVCLNNKPASVNWTDRYFYQQVLPQSVSRKVRPTLDDVIPHAKVFLNFFYSGEIEVGDLTESILCLFYYIKVNDKHFIDTDLLIGTDTWTPPSSSTSKITRIPETDYFMNGTGKGQSKKLTIKVAPSGQNRTLTNIEVDSWYSNMMDNINKKETIHYLAFLAGICCRLIVKEPTSVENAIASNSMDRFSSLFAMRLDVNYSVPPNSKFYIKWQEIAKKLTPNANKLLCTLIVAQLNAKDLSKDDVTGLTKAMCLLSLGAVGLGLLSWAHKAATSQRMTLAKFLARMCIGPYRQAASDVFSLLQFQNEHNQHTFMYARLFREGAFQELSTKQCPEFAMACAAIALNASEEDDIWGILQFANYSQYVPQVCEFAFVFREAFYTKAMCDVNSATGTAREMAMVYAEKSTEYRNRRTKTRLNKRETNSDDEEESESEDDGHNLPEDEDEDDGSDNLLM